MYKFRARLDGSGRDEYDLPIGVRTVEVSESRFLINGEPFYFRGFGRHEDSIIRGRAHDDSVMCLDYDLLNWVGANSFRASHYPYAEEVLDYADRHGIVIIDELHAVSLNAKVGLGLGDPSNSTFDGSRVTDQTKYLHRSAMRELMMRDRNHPCVVLWNVANEPDSIDPLARSYFEPIVSDVRELDPTRPVIFTNVHFAPPAEDVLSDLFDIVCINRYYGWYYDYGDLQSARIEFAAELAAWRDLGKPILLAEYGCGGVAGLHSAVPVPWSEEYQWDLLEMYHSVIDDVPEVIGEHVWTFADFSTPPSIFRFDGNRNGMFTRDRKPKYAAHRLRDRWQSSPSFGGRPASSKQRPT
jgi:beta-glucuronidase